MSISKTFVKSRNSYKVTFQLPKKMNSVGKEIRVLGEFNDWVWDRAPILKSSPSGLKATIELEAGRSYQYRFLIDGEKWMNDDQADGYTPSPFYAVDNCIVRLDKPAAAVKKVKKKVSSKKTKVDFTKIEGIGPKIDGILKTAGYKSYNELSQAKKKNLLAILKDAGKRYQMHDPSTWAKQSKLLAQNKLDELSKLQKKLKGGRA